LKTTVASVVGVHPGGMQVGSSTATACRGDVGGPMLVQNRGAFRVAGVIQGSEGAACASPTEVVPVSTERGWLSSRIAPPSNGASKWARHGLQLLLGWLLIDAAIVAFFWLRRARQ
jgi:hypothetical protein